MDEFKIRLCRENKGSTITLYTVIIRLKHVVVYFFNVQGNDFLLALYLYYIYIVICGSRWCSAGTSSLPLQNSHLSLQMRQLRESSTEKNHQKVEFHILGGCPSLHPKHTILGHKTNLW